MYYQPDTIWRIFGAPTEAEYIQKFVVKGNFHAGVHEDVVKSYDVVEHIMALSYFHYPMYEVALQKLLGIYEMAVKLRSQQVGIVMDYTLKNGAKRKKELNKLIDELVDKALIPELKSVMHHTRKIRNIFAHPDQYSLFGTLSHSVLIPLVNLLNQLFLPQSHHIENNEVLLKTKESFTISETDLFKLEHKNQLILAYAPKLLNTFKVGSTWVSAISFQPVLSKTKELLSEHKIPDGIIRFFKEVEITSKGIKAIDTESIQEILIERTTKTENLEVLKRHLKELKELNELDQVERFIYSSSISDGIDREIQKFVYENCWRN
jgi:hypothetical protein